MVSTQTLHSVLRTFDFLNKGARFLSAGRDLTRPAPNGRFSLWTESEFMADYQFVKNSHEDLKEHLKNQTGIKIDIPDSGGKGGTTTNGNAVRRIIHDHETRQIFLETVPEWVRGRFGELVDRMSIILRVINCGEKLMDLQAYKEFCDSSYRFVLTEFPEMLLSPTVHKVG